MRKIGYDIVWVIVLVCVITWASILMSGAVVWMFRNHHNYYDAPLSLGIAIFLFFMLVVPLLVFGWLVVFFKVYRISDSLDRIRKL